MMSCNYHPKCILAKICGVLVFVGGLNWGLIGVGMLMSKDWNIVHMILVSMPTVEAIVYVLVGIAAFVQICGCLCKTCKGSNCAQCQVPMQGKM